MSEPKAAENGSTTPHFSKEPRGKHWSTEEILTASLLFLIVFLTVLVRVYRLGAQSAWWDDYNGLINLESRSLATSLELARRYNPHGSPLYFLIEYYVSFLIGSSPYAMRCFSIFLNVLTIPFIYWLGRDTLGKKAGLVGALCFALSPIHLYHGQSIRLYPLMLLFAICAVYALWRAIHGGGLRWWAVNVVANALMPWTHLLGVALLAAQGVFLLVTIRRRWRQAIVWGAATAVAMAPVIVWLKTMPWVPQSVFGHFKAPGLKDLFHDLVCDDAIGTGYQIIPHGNTWGFLSARWADILTRHRWQADDALVLVMCICVVWGLARIVQLALRNRRARDEKTQDSVEGILLLLSLWAIPVLALAALSHLWRPCTYPRYTLYSSIGLYLLAGGLVQSIAWREFRAAAVGAIIVLYAYQLSFTIPAAVRTDWIGAAEKIKSQATPDDLITVGGPGPANPHINIFCYNFGPTNLPIVPAHTLQAVLDKAVCYFVQHGPEGPPGQPPRRSVWHVEQRYYAYGPVQELEDALRADGFVFEHTMLMADEKISVYRIQPGPGFDYSGRSARALIPYKRDYPAVLKFLGLTYETEDPRTGERRPDLAKQERAITHLRRVYDDFMAPIEEEDLGMLSTFLLDEGAPDLAAVMAQKGIERHPESPNAHVNLLYVRLEQGDVNGAVTCGRTAVQIGPDNPNAHLALAFALFEKGDTDAGLAEFQQGKDLDREGNGIELLEPLVRFVYLDNDLEKSKAEALRLRAIHQRLSTFLFRKVGLDRQLTTCQYRAN